MNRRRSHQSPMWRSGAGGSAAKQRLSLDSSVPSAMSWREGRDDTETGREGASDIPEEKVKKFDALLKRIEAERVKLATPDRQDATHRRADRTPSSASSANYDFASRARELRMSMDSAPARPGTPHRKEGHFAQLARNMTPRSLGGGGARSRSKSPAPRSSETAPVRSASPLRSSSPNARQADFKLQIEKFHSSLVSAHDTITTLEKDVRHLKKRVDEKDECILSLEKRNKSLDETLAKTRAEKSTLIAEKSAASMKYSDEAEKLQKECNEYKKRVGEMDKLTSESKEKAEEAKKETQRLVDSVKAKEGMITSLRGEIQRLHEELADGTVVRSQALQAEEKTKKLEAELAKAREEHISWVVSMKEKKDEYERQLKEKDNEIAALQAHSRGGTSLKKSNDRMEAKVSRMESQLDEAKAQNDELADKVQDLEKRLARAERAAKNKDAEIEQLEAVALETDALQRQLERERRESERQRKRLERYDADGALEQEAVAALEKAIEDLEAAQNTDAAEIKRLKDENDSLSATVGEAEECMRLYQRAMEEARELRSTLGEVRDANADLRRQLQTKEDDAATLKMQLETARFSSRQKVADLEKQLSTKEDEMTKLESELALRQESIDQEEKASVKLAQIMTSFEENKTELEDLRQGKGRMLHAMSTLEHELGALRKIEEKCSEALEAKRDLEGRLATSQKETEAVRAKAVELEKLVKMLQETLAEVERQAEKAPRSEELKAELDAAKATLAERDEQLAESKKGIAEAQKMIFRLMNTVQDLRKKTRERDSNQAPSE